MTQPGYPPYGGGGGGYGPPGGGGGGYGPPPGGGGYGPPPGGGGGGYGAPPGGGYGAPPGGAYGVPPAPPKKKGGSGVIIGAIVGVVLLFVIGGGIAAFMVLKPKRGLPVDAKDLPTTTKEMSTHLIEATREQNEDVKRIYLASELGGQLCRPGFGDIAHRMEGLGSGSTREAKEFFFDKKKIDAVQQVLECGGLLGGVLDSPYESAFAFDDDGKMRRVLIVKMHATEIPSKFGFSKQTFGAIPGFCRTQEEDLFGSKSDEAPKTVECKDTSHAAFIDPKRPVWYVGDKAALDKVAKTVANPREELTASVTALKDAASQTSGLPDVQLAGTPKTSKDFLMAPCEWAQYKSGQYFDKDFRENCFPAKALDSNIQQVDTKIRGAAFEIDDDFVKAAAIKGNIILVARDDDGAVSLEKDVQEIVTDWKAHVDQHSPKLVKETKDDAHTRKQKEFAAIVDTFFVALQKMKVTRAGRVVRISYNEKLSSGDEAELLDAEQSTREKRVAVAGILTAIQQKKPVPQASLAKLVGTSWAAYLTGPPPPEPKAGMKTRLTPTECHEAQSHLKNVKTTDMTNDDGRMLYIRVKYSLCSASNLPEVSTQEKACLLADYKAPEDLNKCLSFSTGAPNEPPASEFGDNAKKK